MSLFEENLDQEKEALKDVKKVSERLAKETASV